MPLSMKILLAFFFVLLAASMIGCEQEPITGVVVEKYYAPSVSGTGITSGGNVAVTSTDEEYGVFLVNIETGEIERRSLLAENYFRFKVGDTISLRGSTLTNWSRPNNLKLGAR